MKTLDLYLASFIKMHGIHPELTINNGKVYFSFPSIEHITRLNDDFIMNKPVPVADYVTMVKTLRSQMLTLKDSGAR